MFMTPLTESQITAYNTKSASANNDPQAASDRFLKLMVAQLEHQDPLNPMDNAELTSQMAQINTVTGIQQLNSTLQSMSTQFQSLQALQGTSLIGREAVVSGNTLGYSADGVGHGGYILPDAATSVKVHVLGSAGQVLDTVDLGGQTAGQHWFDWNNTDIDRSKVAGFKIVAADGDSPINATTLSSLKIESVGLVDGTLRLRTEGEMAYAYTDVLAFK